MVRIPAASAQGLYTEVSVSRKIDVEEDYVNKIRGCRSGLTEGVRQKKGRLRERKGGWGHTWEVGKGRDVRVERERNRGKKGRERGRNFFFFFAISRQKNKKIAAGSKFDQSNRRIPVT